MSEPFHPDILRRPERTADEEFRHFLRSEVRGILAWRPEALRYASVTGVHPETGLLYTAYAKYEGPGDISVWIREGAGVEPAQEACSRTVVAAERIAQEEAARKRRRR